MPAYNSNSAEQIARDVEERLAREKLTKTMAAEGLLTVKSANEWITRALIRPNPKTWFHGMIVSCENTVLFAGSNVGKSILAVQIAADIAQNERVLYLDLEMSDKQFQLRYTDAVTSRVHSFPENFLRAEINVERLLDEDLEQGIIDSIETAALQGVKVFIIDNITFVCMNAEKGESAGEFMKRIIFLKNKYQLTIIAIAHTPKRYSNSPLTQFDLAGSARLINLFDAGIALGCDVRDKRVRYIKQVKVRTGELLYDEDNVAECEMTTEHGWLHFEITGYGHERDHLSMPHGVEDKEDLIEKIRVLVAKGLSIRQVEEELHISHGTAQRYIHRVKAEGVSSVPSVSGVSPGTGDTPGTADADDIGDLPE